MLCGQWGDMGLPPKKSTFMVHAMIARHYLHGGYYPVGGAWKIADCIIPKIQEAGGEVFTYARVKQIIVDDGVVCGVEMKDGHRISCDRVISAAGVDNTFRHLLPRDIVNDDRLRGKAAACTTEYGSPRRLHRADRHRRRTRPAEYELLDLSEQ